MAYSDYTLDQIKENLSNYQETCNIFLELAQDEKTKHKLEEILYQGGYNGFSLCSHLGNKDNPFLEGERRLAMAHLLIKNPETFDTFIKLQTNLFHGTNANVLPSILKYGLNSVDKSNEQNISVTTGETFSRIDGKRSFVSFTDIIDIAEGYSTIKSESGDESLSFEVIIGTTVNDVLDSGIYRISSDIPEVGVRNNLPLESIKVICVPSAKVDFVKKMIPNDTIQVLPIDGIGQRFYYIDDFGHIEISPERLKELRENTYKQNFDKEFQQEELYRLTTKLTVTKIKSSIEKFKHLLSRKGLKHDTRIK